MCRVCNFKPALSREYLRPDFFVNKIADDGEAEPNGNQWPDDIIVAADQVKIFGVIVGIEQAAVHFYLPYPTGMTAHAET